ncbi:MAG: hypothetical protein RR367_03115 [Clostridia bacterium]
MDHMNHQQQLADSTPDVPECFHNAVCNTLGSIVAQEARASARCPAAPAAWRGRRTLALALGIALLLGTAAYAAYHWNIFDALRFLTGPAPTNADQMMQSNLAHVMVNNVDISVLESGYDGKTLFIQYAYRMNDVDHPVGQPAQEGTLVQDGVRMEDMQLLYDHNVGWWIDHLWIDGKCVDLPNSSGSVTTGSTTPGEIIQTEFWRLDHAEMPLSGKVEIALPIGERQPLENVQLQKHPEMYGEDGALKQPAAGMVSFVLDTADMLSQVRVEHPNVAVRGENVTARVSEVCYSPLLTYITLKLEGDADAIAAYKAQNGDGFYSEDGKTLLWEYGGVDVFIDWVNSLALVNGGGELLFPDAQGYNGCGSEWAEFVYPHIENVPEALYLAPMENGSANMAQAIKVK